MGRASGSLVRHGWLVGIKSEQNMVISEDFPLDININFREMDD